MNTADYSSALSPGILFSIFGSDLAPAYEKATAFPLPSALQGVSVDVIDGSRTFKAPLFFVSSGQVNALMPYEVTSTSVQVRLNTAGGSTRLHRLSLTSRTPRLLSTTMTGNGDAILVHADFNLVTLNNPARAGEVVVLFLTGLGAVSPAVASGQMANDGSPGKPLNQVTVPVTVSVNQTPGTVYFAGLAPGFAGLYQVNFKVPETVAPGVLDISVAIGTEASQPTVRFAVAPATEMLASTTILSSGGALRGAGASLTVPSGAFSSSADVSLLRATTGILPASQRITDVYEIAGLPATTSASMTVTLPLTEAPPSGRALYVLLQELGGGEIMLPAQAQGSNLVVTLPPRAGVPLAAGVPSSRSAAERRAVDSFSSNPILLHGTDPTEWWPSDSTHFRMFYRNDSTTKTADALLQFLESNAIPFLTNEMRLKGLSANYEIHLRPDMPGELLCGGTVSYVSWNNTTVLVLREPPNYPVDSLPTLKVKAAHLLAHALQNPKPRGKEGTRWVWFDEAVAAAAEDHLNVGPDATSPQYFVGWFYAYNGLEFWNTTEDEFALRVHGYGARRFLKSLANSYSGGWNFVGLTYTTGEFLGKATNLPSQALRALVPGIDIGPRWQAYLEAENTTATALSEHALPGGPIPFNTSRMQTLDGTDAATITASWKSSDLSESLFPVTILNTPPLKADLTLSISFSGTTDTIARYLRVRGKQVTVLGQGATFGPVDARAYLEADDQLWIVVMNRHAVAPFTTPAAVSVTVQLKAPVAPPPLPSILDWLKTTRTVEVRLTGAIGICKSTTTGLEMQCISSMRFVNADAGGTAQIKPIQWNGRNFSYSGTISYPGSLDEIHEISGSGVMSADGRTMESGTFIDKSIGFQGRVVVLDELQFGSGLPYVNLYGSEPRADDTSYPYKISGPNDVAKIVGILRHTETTDGKNFWPTISLTYGSTAELTVTFQRPFPF